MHSVTITISGWWLVALAIQALLVAVLRLMSGPVQRHYNHRPPAWVKAAFVTVGGPALWALYLKEVVDIHRGRSA
jgi:hypothetical protein